MQIIRARNMLLIIVLVYVCVTIVMLVSEMSTMSTNVSNMKEVIQLAADTAVSQALASDEFFNDQNSSSTVGSNDLYRTDGVTSVNTASSYTSKSYKAENIFDLVYDFSVDGDKTEKTIAEEKEKLYVKMYGVDSGSVLQDQNFMTAACKIVTRMESLKSLYGGTGLLPNIARLGLLDGVTLGAGGGATNYLNSNSASILYAATMSAIGKTTADATDYTAYNVKKDWLKLTSVIKTYTTSDNGEHTYMLAPTNVGITYLDPYILETAFVSNMDLLMRGDIADLTALSGVVSNGYSGQAQVVNSSAVSEQFMINNGKFTFVKGKLLNSGTIRGWTGGENNEGNRVVPQIDYTLINAKNTDEATMRIMHLAVGLPDSVVQNGEYSVSGYKKWLEDIGVEFEGDYADDPYYVMVARVTFYADAFVSYNTSVARDLYSMFVKNEYNNSARFGQTTTISDINQAFFQVRDNVGGTQYLTESDNASTTSAVTNLPYYAYTMYYAVMP